MISFTSDLAQRNWELLDEANFTQEEATQVNDNFCWNKPLYDNINEELSNNYRLSVINVRLF